MKIAIVHDALMCRGGAEQVVKYFHRAFPDAPIYTLCYKSDLTYPDFKDCNVKTSWLQRAINTESLMKKLFFPFGIIAMRQLYVKDFDIVLISSTHCGKYIRVSPNTKVITYCYTPFRLAWNPASYSQYDKSNFIIKRLFASFLKVLRIIDYQYAQRTDVFLAMTEETRKRISCTYDVMEDTISIIPPPVEVNSFKMLEVNAKKDYFLLVSRIEYYKKVDLVVEAFNILEIPLIIVGKGTKEQEVKEKAKPNIKFKKDLSTDELQELYSNCKAFIFPQYEDYGITPLEANASGRPVIAYGQGGVLTTQIPYTLEKEGISTAIFFNEQSVESLIDAIKLFNNVENTFDAKFIRKHAEKFDEKIFIKKIKEFVYKENQNLRLSD